MAPESEASPLSVVVRAHQLDAGLLAGIGRRNHAPHEVVALADVDDAPLR